MNSPVKNSKQDNPSIFGKDRQFLLQDFPWDSITLIIRKHATVSVRGSDSVYCYYGSSVSEVKRSLYICDVLYTMSSKQIKANSLRDVNTTLATITLLPGDVLYPVVKGEKAGENYFLEFGRLNLLGIT